MDDNKLLTLINGDRIPLTNSMSLLFEVEDLAVASPATVSRAGMIYLDYTEMGYRPFVETWLKKTFGNDADAIALHQELFDKYVDKILAFKELNCKEPVPVDDFNAVKSLCTLYSSLATPENGVDKQESPQTYNAMVEKWFVFSMIWSVMIAVDEPGRVKLDACLRDIEAQFPPMKQVYDYFVDVKKKVRALAPLALRSGREGGAASRVACAPPRTGSCGRPRCRSGGP
jgi:dynein heavy chain